MHVILMSIILTDVLGRIQEEIKENCQQLLLLLEIHQLCSWLVFNMSLDGIKFNIPFARMNQQVEWILEQGDFSGTASWKWFVAVSLWFSPLTAWRNVRLSVQN